MKAFKIVLVVSLLALFTAACGQSTGTGQFRPTTNVQVITQTAYPEFPNIPVPPPVRLVPFQADMPRDLSQTVIRNVTDCRNVPEEQQDDRFWARCGEHPIIPNSNIYIGFSQGNWNNIQTNLIKLQENDFVLRGLLEEANKQREEWRRQAQEERERVKGELTPND